jgi:23S rRNA pseudouridine2605 synthase
MGITLDGGNPARFAMPGRNLVRLDRALSKLGLASRTEARALIASGKVTVGGRTVRDPAFAVVPEPRNIVVEGRSAGPRPWRTIALHKPRGVVATRRDPEGRPTVFDLLGDEAATLVAVGRLDLATTGLLLFTTDNHLADRLTDPSTGIVRRYVVTVRGHLSDEAAARMEIETHLIVELTEGRNREIRRLCEAVGHEVTRLKRIAFGTIELGDLQPGRWRDVTREEIRRTLG